MKVKICGVTTAADARLAVDFGADFIGLNFYRPSPRWLGLDDAVRIRRVVGDRARVAGIFVNHACEEVVEIDRRVGLDYLQFSGDEPPELIAAFRDRAIRVLRMGGAERGGASTAPAGPGAASPGAAEPSRSVVVADAGQAEPAGNECWAILIDRAHKRLYGGTGESWDYASAARMVGAGGVVAASASRLFIAGGIGPDNVAEVAAAVPSAFAVDTCSGVESSPGRKDRLKVERLFANLRTGAAR